MPDHLSPVDPLHLLYRFHKLTLFLCQHFLGHANLGLHLPRGLSEERCSLPPSQTPWVHCCPDARRVPWSGRCVHSIVSQRQPSLTLASKDYRKIHIYIYQLTLSCLVDFLVLRLFSKLPPNSHLRKRSFDLPADYPLQHSTLFWSRSDRWYLLHLPLDGFHPSPLILHLRIPRGSPPHARYLRHHLHSQRQTERDISPLGVRALVGDWRKWRLDYGVRYQCRQGYGT